MRSISLLLLVAACTSETPATPDRMISVSCDTGIAEFCATDPCDQTLEAAKQDTSLCEPGFPPTLTRCGDFDIVSKSEIDSGASYYYQGGQLVAIIGRVAPSLTRCSAGPPTFSAPRCDATASESLPACAPNAR